MTNEGADYRVMKVMKWTLEEEKKTIHQILEKPAEPVTEEHGSAIKSIQALLDEKDVIACFHDYDSTTTMRLDMPGKAFLIGKRQIGKAGNTNENSNIETFLARCTQPTEQEGNPQTIIYTKDFIHYQKFKGKLSKAEPSNGGEVEKLAPVTSITNTQSYNLSVYVSYVRLLQEYQLRNITRDGDDIITITRHYYNDGLFYNIKDISDGVIKIKFIRPKDNVKHNENYSNLKRQIDNIIEHAERRGDDVNIKNSNPPEVYDNPKPYVDDGKKHFLIVQKSEQDFCPFIEARHEVKGYHDFTFNEDGEGDFLEALKTAWCDLHRLRVLDPLQEVINTERMQDIASKLGLNIFLIISCNKKKLVAYNFISHDGETETNLTKEKWCEKLGHNQQGYINHICLYGESDATTLISILETKVRYHAMLKKPKIHNKVLQNNLSFYYSLIYALSGVSILRNYWVSRDPARNRIFYDLDDDNNTALQHFKTLIDLERFVDDEELSVRAYIKLLETLVRKLNGVYISLRLEQTPITVFLLFGNSGHVISYENPGSPPNMKYRIDLRMVYENGECRFDFLSARSNDNHMDIIMGGVNRIDRIKEFPAIATRVPLRPEASNSFNADSRRARMMGLLHIGPQVLGKNEKTQTLYLQYIEGQDLARLVADNNLTTDIITKLSNCIVNLVAMTVEVGIVHLDFKPANIMVSTKREGDFVRILDWDTNLVVGIHECTNDLECNDVVFRMVAARLMLGQLISHLIQSYKGKNTTRDGLVFNLNFVRNEIPKVAADSEFYKNLCVPKKIPKEAPPSVILNNSIILKKLRNRNINDKLEYIINHYFVKKNLDEVNKYKELNEYKNQWLGTGLMTADKEMFLKRIPKIVGQQRYEQRQYMSKELSDACNKEDPLPFVSVVDEADATPIEVEMVENLMEIAMENEKSDLDIRRRWNRDDDLPSRVKPECLPKSPRAKSARGPP